MSYIEKTRGRYGIIEREMWNNSDIAEHCNISLDKADRIHMLANKECGVIGYGDICKDDFLEFLAMVESAKESRRLQDEANIAAITYSHKGYKFSRLSFIIGQAISLLGNH